MKTVAFLQNQWFKDPARIAISYARGADDPHHRAKLNARYLFYRSLTGKRLRAAFGEACDDVVWEEASPKVAGKSDGCFPADLDHMRGVLDLYKPDIVLAFGRIAAGGCGAIQGPGVPWYLIAGPHPAARHATVEAELSKMAAMLARFRGAARPAEPAPGDGRDNLERT